MARRGITKCAARMSNYTESFATRHELYLALDKEVYIISIFLTRQHLVSGLLGTWGQLIGNDTHNIAG